MLCDLIEYAHTISKSYLRLDLQAGLAPVPPLSVVSDGVASAQTNPLGDGTVLALSLSKLLLGAEGLVARHLEGLDATASWMDGEESSLKCGWFVCGRAWLSLVRQVIV